MRAGGELGDNLQRVLLKGRRLVDVGFDQFGLEDSVEDGPWDPAPDRGGDQVLDSDLSVRERGDAVAAREEVETPHLDTDCGRTPTPSIHPQ